MEHALSYCPAQRLEFHGVEIKKRVVSVQNIHFKSNFPESVLKLSYTPIPQELHPTRNKQILDVLAVLSFDESLSWNVKELRSSRLRTPISNSDDIYVIEDYGIKIKIKLTMHL